MAAYTILGCSHDEDLYFCNFLSKRIVKVDPAVSVDFEILLEVDYLQKLKKLTEVNGGELYTHKASHIVLRNGGYVGDIIALIRIAVTEYGIHDAEIANTIAFRRSCNEETERLLCESGRSSVFMEFKDESSKGGIQFDKLVIEL